MIAMISNDVNDGYQWLGGSYWGATSCVCYRFHSSPRSFLPRVLPPCHSTMPFRASPCHSERSEESPRLRFFTPLRSVQNDMAADCAQHHSPSFEIMAIIVQNSP